MCFDINAKIAVPPRIFCCFIPPPSTRWVKFLCIILIDTYLRKFRLLQNLHLSSTILHPRKTRIISNIHTTHYLDNTFNFKIVVHDFIIIIIFDKSTVANFEANTHFRYLNILRYLFTFTTVKINCKPFRGKSTVVREKLRTVKKNFPLRKNNFPSRKIASGGGGFKTHRFWGIFRPKNDLKPVELFFIPTVFATFLGLNLIPTHLWYSLIKLICMT